MYNIVGRKWYQGGPQKTIRTGNTGHYKALAEEKKASSKKTAFVEASDQKICHKEFKAQKGS